MDANILKILGQIAGIGGFSLGLVLLIYREIVRKQIFPQLAKHHAYKLLLVIIVLTWIVAMSGISAWVWMGHNSPSTPSGFAIRSFYEKFLNAATLPEKISFLDELALNIATSSPAEKEVAAHYLAKLIVEYKIEIDGDQQKRRVRQKMLEIMRKAASDKLYTYFDRVAFRGIDMAYFNFSDTTLPHMNFQGAWLINADFSNADLDGSDFSGASLRGADFSGAKYVANANFIDSDWFNALGLVGRAQNIKQLGHLSGCPETRNAMIQFHDRKYDIKFHELSQDLTNDLIKNWELLWKSGICKK